MAERSIAITQRILNKTKTCGKFPDMENDKPAPQGNPNPSPATRFGAGERANPQGRTSEQRKMEIANAEKATKLRAMFLDAVANSLEHVSEKERAERIDAAMLKLLTDSETRGLGAPTQHVDNTSSDGSMTPAVIERVIVQPEKPKGEKK